MARLPQLRPALRTSRCNGNVGSLIVIAVHDACVRVQATRSNALSSRASYPTVTPHGSLSRLTTCLATIWGRGDLACSYDIGTGSGGQASSHVACEAGRTPTADNGLGFFSGDAASVLARLSKRSDLRELRGADPAPNGDKNGRAPNWFGDCSGWIRWRHFRSCRRHGRPRRFAQRSRKSLCHCNTWWGVRTAHRCWHRRIDWFG